MKPRAIFIGPDGNRFNVDAAKLYGEITFIIPKGDNPSPLNVDRFGRLILDRLDDLDFDPDSDYIGMTGPHLNMALLFGLALAEYGRLKVLMFDARKSFYQERLITEDE